MASLSARALTALLGEWLGGTGPTYATLADRIRLLVLDGRIPLGTRLPAERELAAALHLSRTTITSAYAALRDAGYATSLRGSGTQVRLPASTVAAPEVELPGYLDFSKATMPASPSVLAAAERAAAALPAHLSLSGFDPIGLVSLRQRIADRYSARGLPTDVDQVLVTIGAQHAISLVARTLLTRGDRVLIENPSYPHAVEAFGGAGGRLVPVPVTTDGGWDLDAFEQAITRQNPSLGYLMPDWHNPTGRTMSREDRRRVLDLAARQGTVLVADETMGELGFPSSEAHPPFAVDAPPGATTVTIGSVGKSLWGGIRIGWIRSSAAVIQRLARARNTYDLGTPVLEQLLVAEILTDYDDILDERRRILEAGYRHLSTRLREAFPTWHVPEVGGGLTLWVGLGEPVSSQLTLAARSAGLLIAAGPRFSVDGAFERFLRVPFCYPVDELDRGVAALQQAWAAVRRAPLPADGFLAEVV